MKIIRKHLKYIFPLIVMIMIAGLILSRVHRLDSTPPEPEIRIDAEEATNYIGTVAEVCGEVATARYIPQIGGEPTFLNLGSPDPDQFFTAVIWGKSRNKWKTPPEQMYSNKKLCISGMIEDHEGTPQIIVEYPQQIKIQNKN